MMRPASMNMRTCLQSGSTLYIVSPCYATSGCLAVIDLPTGKIRYISSAMDIFVIRGGSRSGDLIYMRRLNRQPTEADPRIADYKYIHARLDGTQIAIISGEALVLVGGNGAAPILRNYLRRLHGRIFVQGERVPEQIGISEQAAGSWQQNRVRGMTLTPLGPITTDARRGGKSAGRP
jgi:hypothetical protein